MIDAVRDGKPGTAMKGFKQLLSEAEITQVVSFVRQVFIQNKEKNTVYHSRENGWENHQRYRDAFPFVSGEIALDTPWESLSEIQRKGKQLFMSSCVSCHDRATVKQQGLVWESRPLSYPRNQYSHKTADIDTTSSASPYALHDKKMDTRTNHKDPRYLQGQQLFQQNCTFCHANDGSGKNWIGQFILPHPRDLTQAAFLGEQTIASLSQKISEGVKGSAMPAWKTVMSPDQIDAIAFYLLSQ